MSVSEPEIPKPDESVVETPSPNFLGDLEAQSKALREELDTARQRLAVVEKQIADSAADRPNDEALRQQLKQTQDELAAAKQELAEKDYNYSTLVIISQQLNQQLEAERADRAQAELKKQLDSTPTKNHQDYDQLLESSSATIDNQRKVIALLQSRLRQEREEREKLEAQLSELQQRLDAADHNPPPAIDLSDKAGKVVNFFRTLLPKDTKLPKNTMSKLREILEATED